MSWRRLRPSASAKKFFEIVHGIPTSLHPRGKELFDDRDRLHRWAPNRSVVMAEELATYLKKHKYKVRVSPPGHRAVKCFLLAGLPPHPLPRGDLMISIILVTHGQFGQELLRTAQDISGRQDGVASRLRHAGRWD